MTLRLELFVDDIAASVDFYTRVLKFTTDRPYIDGYTPISNGEVLLGLNLRASLHACVCASVLCAAP